MINIDKLSADEVKDIVNGKKVLIKNNKLGEVGDILSINDCKYKLISVDLTSLPSIASTYYRVLGFETPIEFINNWQEKHNIHEFASSVFIHYFDKI